MAKRAKTAVGLDVGSRSVHLVVLRAKKNGLAVERTATRELPHNAIVEGTVLDPHIVCDTVAALLKENRVRGKDTAVALSGRRVMIKRIVTEEMSDEELRQTIPFEAKNNLTFDTSDVTLDYVRLPQEDDSGRMNVLLVAAKNEVVFDAVQTVRSAGARPVLLEAEPFALQAVLTETEYLDPEAVVAVLQVGFYSTDVTLFRHGQFETNRNLSIGGKSFLEGLIRELGITFDRAAALLGPAARTPDEEEALQRVAGHVSARIAEQVERSFPEYFRFGSERSVTRIVLCGGGAHLPLLETALQQRFGVEVVKIDPFRGLEQPPQSREKGSAEPPAEFATAAGLALRALNDRHPGFNLLFPEDRPQFKRTKYAGLKTVLPVVAVSAVLFVMLMLYLAQENSLTTLRAKLADVRRESALYQDKIALVEELTKKRADIAARIDVIAALDRNRFARVRLLQLLNDCLPEHTWLTSVQETATPRGPGVNIIGLTSSNLRVSQFMTNLLQSQQVRSVDLLVSEQTTIAETRVTRFTLQVAAPDLGLTAPAPPPAPEPLKRGAQALKQRRAATEKLSRETAH